METTQEAVMLNRKIVVDVVKKDKASSSVEGDSTEITFEDKAAIVASVVERGIRRITFAMMTYVLMDTYRKIAVAHATKK
jgi:hypothetical protein